MGQLLNRGFALKVANATILVSLIVLASLPAGFASSETPSTQAIAIRNVPLTIKLVLIGFDSKTIEQDYLTWRGNAIQNSVNNVLSTGNITGVTYNLTYKFVYTSDEFQDSLVNYLKSIQQKKVAYNPWFKSIMTNYFYDAKKVEAWFAANNASYGGFPRNGYTFVFANLTSLPSVTEKELETEDTSSATAHYYSTRYVDKDLDYQIRYRDFAVGWGGEHRLWYIDMAAGPEFWTWTADAVPHLPLQLAIDLFRLDIHSAYGKQWLTQYVADYIYDAVLNLAIPVFVYQPVYSHTYRIVVNVIDNRTSIEKKSVRIESTIHPDLIKQAYVDLFPYSTIQVETHFITASDNPDLQKAIIENTVTPPSDLGISRYVDTRPIYRYLQEHLTEFVGNVERDSTEFTLPVFAFAFAGGVYFGYTYKWYVADLLKIDEDNFQGISLGDMSLIGMNQNDFRRGDIISPPQPGKGIGFTQTVIHEVGHSVGLMHPHQFGYLQDFVASPMSYWSWEYKFGQFDKDTINRAHADQLINFALTTIAETQSLLSSHLTLGSVADQINSARTLLDKALEKYDSMQYALAVEIASRASQAASNAYSLALAAPSWVTAVLASLIIGIITGSLLIFMALRKFDEKTARRR